jgi:hypothetical protein
MLSAAHDSELTPVAAKQLLAVRVVYATLTGVAVLTVPPRDAAMTGAMSGFDVIAIHAIKKLGARRLDHAAETVVDAADAAETPLAEFIDKAVSDDRRHELFARTLAIAQDTALREKRRALVRALANGIMNDEATIDTELLFISAIAYLDDIHIRVLARIPVLPPPDQRPSGITPSKLLQEDPGVGEGILVVTGGCIGLMRDDVAVKTAVSADWAPAWRPPTTGEPRSSLLTTCTRSAARNITLSVLYGPEPAPGCTCHV